MVYQKKCRHDGASAVLAIAAGVFFVLLGFALPATAAEEVWPDLKENLFGDRVIEDGTDWLVMEAPYRAEDAAIVPIGVKALRTQTPEQFIKTITLVIDQNPAPVAAVLHFSQQSGLASFATRVRVNAYTDVRAIAETSDGKLYMVSKFVKASGGCSAPAGKDHEEAMANLGKMRMRFFPAAEQSLADNGTGGLREAQLMIRHPNYSGLQMDQITRNYTPAHFVRDIEIRRGDDLIVTVEGAISLSENPTLRFYFRDQGLQSLSARIEDTEDSSFSGTWDMPDTKAPES